MIVAEICGRNKMLARSNGHSTFHGLSFQIGGIHFELPEELAVHEQRGMERVPTDWAGARSMSGEYHIHPRTETYAQRERNDVC